MSFQGHDHHVPSFLFWQNEFKNSSRRWCEIGNSLAAFALRSSRRVLAPPAHLNTNCNPAQVYVQSEVPEGKAPALIVVPKGIQGSFFVLPDRIHPGTYMALNYRKLLPEQEGGQQREVHWMSRLPPKQI